MTIFIKNKHTLQIDEFRLKCCIGKNGSTLNKKGDKKTPKGLLKLEIFITGKIVKKTINFLKCIEIKSNMAWCDDIRFPKK